MLTGETALLTSLLSLYCVYTRACHNVIITSAAFDLCGPNYAHRCVWEKLVHLFVGMYTVSAMHGWTQKSERNAMRLKSYSYH